MGALLLVSSGYQISRSPKLLHSNFLLKFIVQISRMQCTHFIEVLNEVLTYMCLHWSIDGPVDGAVHKGLITITHTSSERLSHLKITT